ncbi:MAG TPA: carbohydrate-binding family 9-like protein [Phycisphaerae bacterium]|nr:carbohydrate-binding family 9-like protein [Phycisphaerae bacterium]
MSESKTYLVRRAPGAVRLASEDPAWGDADRLLIDEYPWFTDGQKQQTDVALLYDDRAVYVLFVCEDRHIFSVETRPNGDVYKDSCVELFADPAPARGGGYFNFEANCCGVMHLGFGAGRGKRRLADAAIHEQIRVATSIPIGTKDESPNDDGWWLAAKLPFETLSAFTGVQVQPAPGDTWRANFYRCGGKTDGQYACWNPITAERPDFHRPECFGTLQFE